MPPHPRPSARSRSSRLLVVLCCAALAALLALSVVLPHAASSWPWIATAVATAALWLVLRRRTRGVAELSAARLDERDLATRGRAAWWGLLAATTAGAAVALALVVAARLDSVDARAVLDRSGPVLLTLVLAASLVPTLVLAATTDPVAESGAEDDDEEGGAG